MMTLPRAVAAFLNPPKMSAAPPPSSSNRSLPAAASPAPSASPSARPPSPPRAVKFKDCTDIARAITPFPTRAYLTARLLSPEYEPGPADRGTLSLIVLRPAVNERAVVPRAYASCDGGIAGSGWTRSEAKGLTDQVCVMSAAAIRAVVGDAGEDAWPAAGDQLFIDMDVTEHNMAVGDRLRIGRDVEMEVTRKPHNGCMKFVARYGEDALGVLNCREGRARRLRGIYFSVVQDGWIAAGDEIVKLPRAAG
jgi:hypothetical protein